MYVLVYEQAFRDVGRTTLRDSAVDWTLMKNGFKDFEATGRTPAGAWRNFANLACQMRDRAEARRLYALADSVERDPSAASDACRTFAMAS